MGRTPLYQEHVALAGKMVPYAGYSLPVHFPAGIQSEHGAVRTAAGLFDVSHMGGLEVSGPNALDLVQWLSANDASVLEGGDAQYSVLCRADGGVIDDLIVMRRSQTDFLLVVNGATRVKDREWVLSQARSFDVEVHDGTEAHALMALQGPKATDVLWAVGADRGLDALRPFQFLETRLCGMDALVSRTGYTGEDGFEIRVAAGGAAEVWRALLDGGEAVGIVPAGLGARDILRLEMGYPLYGADLDENHSPLEAGLGWVVKLEKEDFVGRNALRAQREQGISRRLAGIRLEERGFPRPGYPVEVDGRAVGTVTSGTMSPSMGTGIAMAYLPVEHAVPDTAVGIRIRNRSIAARVVRPPFYRDGSRKR